jgi:hypothetical protein
MARPAFSLRPTIDELAREQEMTAEVLPSDLFSPCQTPLVVAPALDDLLRSPLIVRELRHVYRFDVCQGRVLLTDDAAPPPGAVLSIVTATLFGHAAAPERIEFTVEEYRDGAFVARRASTSRLTRPEGEYDGTLPGASRLSADEEALLNTALATIEPRILEELLTARIAVLERRTPDGCLRLHERIDGRRPSVRRGDHRRVEQVVGGSIVLIEAEDALPLLPLLRWPDPVHLIDGPRAAIEAGGDPRTGTPPRS